MNPAPSLRSLDARVHQFTLCAFIDHGAAPTVHDLSEALGIGADEAESSLRRLHDAHSLVLHPSRAEVWVAHPFSSTPTPFWVESDRGGWWAPCIWCAFGVVALVGEPARIHTRLGGEVEPVVIAVANGITTPTDLVAHFPIPVVQAWENVHRFCASTLVFRAEADIDRWCQRHGYARGDVRPLRTVYALGRRWYGGHLANDWRKWTADEARQLFAEVGLTGPAWSLPQSNERF